jgi:hypothetical protein
MNNLSRQLNPQRAVLRLELARASRDHFALLTMVQCEQIDDLLDVGKEVEALELYWQLTSSRAKSLMDWRGDHILPTIPNVYDQPGACVIHHTSCTGNTMLSVAYNHTSEVWEFGADFPGDPDEYSQGSDVWRFMATEPSRDPRELTQNFWREMLGRLPTE